MDYRTLYSALAWTAGPDAVRSLLIADGVIDDDGPIPPDADDAAVLSIYASFLADTCDEREQADALACAEQHRAIVDTDRVPCVCGTGCPECDDNAMVPRYLAKRWA